MVKTSTRAGSVRSAALVVAAALALSACGEPERQRSAATAGEAPANISERMKVLNADTFVIDGTHLRLAGVFAPQGIPDSRCWAEAMASKQATEAVRRMVASARSVRFDPIGGTDSFNRQYANVTLSGLDLAQTLYDEGLVAKAQGGFGWCGPISQNEAGAPALRSLFDVGG